MEQKPTRIVNDFLPVYDERSRFLILGTLPSVASRKAGFYYMNPQNRFWKMLAALFDEPFPSFTKEEKINALLRRGIALFDVVGDCEIKSSSDASIKKANRSDLTEILRAAPIRKILLNGQKAYSLFLKFYPESADPAILLPSTSPANAKCSLSELIRVWGDALEIEKREVR